MIFPSPQIDQLPMAPGAILYRGLSGDELAVLDSHGTLRLQPREPLRYDFSIGFHFASRQQLATEQAMDMRRRSTSLSLSRDIATWYATSGGYEDGVLAICRAPHNLLPEYTSGAGPSLWVEQPGERLALFDARSALWPEELSLWHEGLSRSIVDHEILLANGVLVPVEFVEIQASQCPDVKPWAYWGVSEFPSPKWPPNRPPRRRGRQPHSFRQVMPWFALAGSCAVVAAVLAGRAIAGITTTQSASRPAPRHTPAQLPRRRAIAGITTTQSASRPAPRHPPEQLPLAAVRISGSRNRATAELLGICLR